MYKWQVAFLFTILVALIYAVFLSYDKAQNEAQMSEIAVNQVQDDNEAYTEVKALVENRNALYAGYATAIAIILIWLPILAKRMSGMSKPKRQMMVMLLPVVLLAACKPYNTPQYIEIGPNETAFVVPLGGDTSEQLQFQSVEYLQSNQVAAKRIFIPKEEIQVGRMFWEVEYIPAIRVVIVDRTPVTREWTSSGDTGTSTSNQAFGVESSESIDFRVGATCSARVDEEDAAAFLYYFSGRSLAEVMDQNIRGFIQAELFREFGALDLANARTQKGDIFQRVFIATRDHFAPLGVTITSLGGSDGLMYTDPNVQNSINANFEAQQEQVRQEAAATAQAVDNQRQVSQANADAQQEQVRVEALATAQAVDNERLVSQANAQATATVVAGQAQAEVIRSEGEAEAEVLALQGAQIEQYPSLVNYELAQNSQGQVPQFLIVGEGNSGNLPFGFFLDPQDIPAVGN